MGIEVTVGEKKIEVVVDDFAEFVATYTAFVSRDGVLVQTDRSLSKGLDVEVVFRLADGFVLIEGRGLVAWSQPASGDRPGGIGLHFLVLEEDSKELVDRMVSNHIAAGGEPFDVDRLPGDPGAETEPPVLEDSPTEEGRIPVELTPEGSVAEVADSVEDSGPGEVNVDAGGEGVEEGAGPAFAPGMGRADDLQGAIRPEMPESVVSLLSSSEQQASEPAEETSVEAPQHDLEAVAEALADLEADSAAGEGTGEAGAPPSAARETSDPEIPGPEIDEDASLDDMLRELSEELGADEDEPAAEEASAAVPAVSDPGGSAEAALDEEVENALAAIRLPGEEDEASRPSTEVKPPPDLLDPEPPGDESLSEMEEEVDLALDSIGPQTPPSVEAEGQPVFAPVDTADPESGRLVLDLDAEPEDQSVDLGDSAMDPLSDEMEIELPLPEAQGFDPAIESAADEGEVELDFGPADDAESVDSDWASSTLEESRVDAAIDLLGDGSEISLFDESSDPGHDAPLDLEALDHDLEDLSRSLGDHGDSEPAFPRFEAPEREETSRSPMPAFAAPPKASPVPDPTPTPTPAVSTLGGRRSAANVGEAGSDSLSLGRATAAVDYFPTKAKGRRRRRIQVSSLVPLILLIAVLGGIYFGVTRVFSEEYALLRGYLFGEDNELVAGVSLEDGLQVQAGEAKPLRDMDPQQGSDPRVVLGEETGIQRPVTVIENVMWEREPNATVIELWGNGVFAASAVGYLRIDGDRPRAVLKIRGITRPFWQATYRLKTPEIEGLRFGYHVGQRVSEVHVVIDLADPSFRVTDLIARDNRLQIRVSR